jgi:hypothetical protein
LICFGGAGEELADLQNISSTFLSLQASTTFNPHRSSPGYLREGTATYISNDQSALNFITKPATLPPCQQVIRVPSLLKDSECSSLPQPHRLKMEAFSNMGNHLVSNSAAAINASDDISTVDPDESVLSLAKGPRRRRHDDEESEGIEDDDMESLASVQVNGQKQDIQPEEEKELPPHACAYVFKLHLSYPSKTAR